MRLRILCLVSTIVIERETRHSLEHCRFETVYTSVHPITRVALLLLMASPVAQQGQPPVSDLIILSDTGQQHDGRPIVVRAARPEHLAVLTRGYSARLLRLYRLAQRYAHPERAPQPAYLLLSDNQGGFPRFGFELDGKVYPDTAYVDLDRQSDLSGRAGAMDQIFPHELLHIIVKALAGEAPEEHASQVHAIAVRTDRVTAFNEGFAEHGQLMAIDAEDGVPATRALAMDVGALDRTSKQFDAYLRALSARWTIAPRARMTFPIWFSGAEQVFRYHGVKADLFAHEADVPERLYSNRTAYDAYLIENVLPGRPDGPPKSAARMLATEGVVSALFYRLVNAPAIRNVVRDEPFYARFGALRTAIDPLDNAYLKVFAAIHEGRYDTGSVFAAYGRLFPDESDEVEAVRRETMLGQKERPAQELWLLNEEFKEGTSLFDQYRALPRAHVFDLNAGSRADFAAIRRVGPQLASAIIANAPYTSIDDLQRVRGMTPELIGRFREMKRAMDAPSAPGTSREGELTLKRIMLPYLWRALAIWAICAIAAAALYRAVRRVSWWRLLLNGMGAALVGLITGWTLDTGNGLLALVVPVVLFGVPGAILMLWRSRSPRDAGVVVGAWALASFAAALAVRPLG
jgi:hypothetical protein